MSAGRRPRIDHLFFDAVGLVCLAMGLYKIIQGTRTGINCYDEGILLSHTRTLWWGGWPYRDFYSQYPPGIYFLLRGLWSVFGPYVLVGRYLSEILRLAIGIASGLAAGRLARRRFSVLPAGLVMLWLGQMWPIPLAWLVAMPCALGSTIAISWAAKTLARERLIVLGLLLGGVASFRHDLLIYLACGLTVIVAVWGYRRRLAPRDAARAAGWVAVGAALPLIVFWVPTLLHAPWKTIYQDIYADQVRYVVPARQHPLPPMTEPVHIDHIPWQMPSFLASFPAMTYTIVFLAPVLGALALLRACRGARIDALLAASLTALAVAVLPQALGRSDWFHSLGVVLPGATLAGAWPYTFRARGGRWFAAPALLVGAAVLLFCGRTFHGLYPPEGPLFPPVSFAAHDGSPFTRGIDDAFAEPRRQLSEYLATVTAREEPVFAGNRNHALVLLNEADLFYVIDHPSATRYLQYDPGIVTRAEVQREMVRDLETKQTRVAILSNSLTWTEPFNDSSKPGSTLLDEYLAAHYHVVRTIGPYEVRMRN